MYSIRIFSLRKKCTSNFATRKLVLLPGLAPGSKRLLPPKKNEFLGPAPENLLRVIRCNCMADCSTLRCTCKKHNIECSPACGNCRGSGCTNILQLPCGDDEDDDIADL